MNPVAGWDGGLLRGETTRIPADPVVKCGGSLLTMADWPARLRACHATLAAAGTPLIVVGGGAIVDGLRHVDAAGGLDGAVVHDLAIALMGITGRLVAGELGLPLTASACGGGVLDAAAFLADERAACPRGWEVTSDSIAALAARVAGRPLLLLKSCPPPVVEGEALEAAAAAGWVDDWFPRAAAGLTWIGWACPGPGAQAPR